MDNCDVCIADPSSIIQPKEVKGRLLYCTCPSCGKKVAADIYDGVITCPACNTKASWQD